MKFVVIGNFILYFLLFVMYRVNFNFLGLDDIYEVLNILIEDFYLIKEIILKKELEGFNIIIFYKECIILYLDYVDE